MSSHDSTAMLRGGSGSTSAGPGGAGKRPLPPEEYPSVDSFPAPPPELQLQHLQGQQPQQQQHPMQNGVSRHPSSTLKRQTSVDSGSHHSPYPAPAAPGHGVLTRELSSESSHSHSPGPEHRPQHQHQHQHRSHTPPCVAGRDSAAYPGGREGGYHGGGCKEAGYPSCREHAYPNSRDRYLQGEQQHLLAYRSSPAPCCKHGGASDIFGVGASDYPLKRQRSTRSTASRRRQNEDGCTTCLRGTLHCYNVCILIIGCAALGVGVWLLVTDFGARNVTPIVGNQLYEVTTYLLIAGGGAVALLAFCGCCGTIREDKCVLSFYGTTLAIVLIVLGVACGLAFFFRGVISDHIKKRMKDTLAVSYGMDVRTNVENRRITESWDAMQRQLQCCGVYGNTSNRNAWKFYSQATRWVIKENQKSEKRYVPDSCCAKGDIQLCTGIKEFQGPPLFFDHHLEDFREINPYLYTTGCYDKLIDYLKTYSAVVGCVAAVVPLFLVLGIVVSFCLCARVAGISSDEEVEL